jgi:hypothetical protein
MNELEIYFKRLKREFYLPEELQLRWIPDNTCPYRGCVSGNIIYIFDEDLNQAKETLLHEILDLFVTKLSFIIKEPKIARTRQTYELKEVVVETLRKKMKNFERPLLIDKSQIGQVIGSEIIVFPAKKATKEDVERAKEKLRKLRK